MKLHAFRFLVLFRDTKKVQTRHKEVCSDKGTRGYAGKAAKLLEGTLILLEI